MAKTPSYLQDKYRYDSDGMYHVRQLFPKELPQKTIEGLAEEFKKKVIGEFLSTLGDNENYNISIREEWDDMESYPYMGVYSDVVEYRLCIGIYHIRKRIYEIPVLAEEPMLFGDPSIIYLLRVLFRKIWPRQLTPKQVRKDIRQWES